MNNGMFWLHSCKRLKYTDIFLQVPYFFIMNLASFREFSLYTSENALSKLAYDNPHNSFSLYFKTLRLNEQIYNGTLLGILVS